MLSRLSLLSHIGLLSFASALPSKVPAGVFYRRQDQTCNVYGVDFQYGQTYFQNVTSSDPFTFVQEFEGCENDVATNFLVDPNGDQVQCSNTPMQPDDADQLSTCPTLKNQLVSGDWSILIVSNNGEDGAPIAQERDFSLIVGTPSTTTFTPTVTATFTTTPVLNVSTTVTDTSTITLSASTTTVPSVTVKPTTTVTPKRVTTTLTKTILTLHLTKPTLVVVKSTVVKTASCKVPKRAQTPDPIASITPTLVYAAALETSTASAQPKFRRTPNGGIEFDRERFLRERREVLAAQPLAKRAPDSATVTVTDTNTADYVTQTSTVTGSTVTVSTTSTVQVTSTSTPPVVTVQSGKTTAAVTTVTAPTPTRTVTKYTIATAWTTKTYSATVKITTTTTPAAVKSSCIAAGGTLV